MFAQLEKEWQELDFTDVAPHQYMVVFEDSGPARAFSDSPYAAVEKHDSLESAQNRMRERACENLSIGILNSAGELLYCNYDGKELFRDDPSEDEPAKPKWWERTDLSLWIIIGLVILAMIWIFFTRD